MRERMRKGMETYRACAAAYRRGDVGGGPVRRPAIAGSRRLERMLMLDTERCETFRRLIGGARRLVLTTHMNPDGDAIGSEIGLARVLAAEGGKSAS